MADAKPDVIDAASLIGRVLDDRYRLDGVLGQGGMGMVFQATQVAMGRSVAVKTLHPSLAMAPTFYERFKREAEIASRLKHPNIVTIFDFGRTADGICYYVMEHLEGESLRQQVKRDGPMTLRRAVAIVEQIALGLGHAHKQNVIHRDMKPHNVMVTSVDQHEYVKVLDFGLVKAMEAEDEEQLTSTGQVLGTPQYMPPEQAGGETVDARSDLYSLGGVLYYCLTGSSPYGANSVRKALTASLTQPLPSVASKRVGAPVPKEVEEFLRKAIAKEQVDRYQSAEEFVADLTLATEQLADAVLDAQPQAAAGTPGAAGSGASEKKDGSGSSGSRPRAHAERSKSGARSRPLPRPQDPPPVDRRVTAPEVPLALEAAAAAPAPGHGSRPGSRSGSRSSASKVKPASKSGTRAVIIGAIFAIAVGGAFAAMRLMETPVATPKPEQPSKVEVAVPVVQKPVEKAADEVTVLLRTTPPGAAVLEDGVMVGKTPIERRWPKDEVRQLTFQLAGYVEKKKVYRLTTNEELDESLEPIRKGTPVKAPVVKTPKEPDISAFE